MPHVPGRGAIGGHLAGRALEGARLVSSLGGVPADGEPLRRLYRFRGPRGARPPERQVPGRAAIDRGGPGRGSASGRGRRPRSTSGSTSTPPAKSEAQATTQPCELPSLRGTFLAHWAQQTSTGSSRWQRTELREPLSPEGVGICPASPVRICGVLHSPVLVLRDPKDRHSVLSGPLPAVRANPHAANSSVER